MGWGLPQPYVLICDYEETKVNKNGSFDFNNFLMHPMHILLLLIMIVDKHLYQNIAICCLLAFVVLLFIRFVLSHDILSLNIYSFFINQHHIIFIITNFEISTLDQKLI